MISKLYKCSLYYLERTILVSSNLMVPVTIAIQGREHDTEWSSPLAEKDEEMVPKALLREEETSMMHYDTNETRKMRREALD